MKKCQKLMDLSTGPLKELLPQLKIKVNVDPVGLSLPPELLKDTGKSARVLYPTFLNNNWLIAQKQTTDVMVDGHTKPWPGLKLTDWPLKVNIPIPERMVLAKLALVTIKSVDTLLDQDVLLWSPKLTLNPPPYVLMPPTGLSIKVEPSLIAEHLPIMPSWPLGMTPMEIGSSRTLGELDGDKRVIWLLRQETLVLFVLNWLMLIELKTFIEKYDQKKKNIFFSLWYIYINIIFLENKSFYHLYLNFVPLFITF
jgi:hypothetical protein